MNYSDSPGLLTQPSYFKCSLTPLHTDLTLYSTNNLQDPVTTIVSSGGFSSSDPSLTVTSDTIGFSPSPLPPPEPGTFTVTNTSDIIDPDDGVMTLREAIHLANTTPGTNTINFNLGTGAQTIVLTGGQLTIQDTVIINGTDNLTISGNGRSRIFEISSHASATLSKLSLVNGAALLGGGAIANAGTINLVDVTLSGNNSLAGGALANGGSAYLTNVTINNNRSINGGGIYNTGYLSVSNSTISRNDASSDGGGLYSTGGVEIRSSTFTLNMADWDNDKVGDGGGIRVQSGTITIQNTIVANNFDGVSIGGDLGGNLVRHYDVSGNFSDLGYNLIGDGTGSTGWTVRSRVGTSTQRIDPRLAPLRNNGGFTQTHALLQDSLALNAGNTGTATLTDQRGVQRTVADIGAYEAALPQITVDLLIDEDDGNINAGDVSLREALRYINDGGIINFASDLRGTITLNLGELSIDRDLTINGTGAKHLTISGDNRFRVFSIAHNSTVYLDGLTIANGCSFSSTDGAGISNAGNLTITNSMIRDNLSYRWNAAISNQENATLNLYNSTVFNNKSFAYETEKYPISSVTAINNQGAITIRNSTISGHRGFFAIYNTGTLSISSSTFANPTYFWEMTGGDISLKNTIVAGDLGIGRFVSQGHNLISRHSRTGPIKWQSSDIVGTLGEPIDPKLGELQDNGGSTWTHALLAGSPALNAADPYDRPQTDQRGINRGNRPDIGAYENAPAIAQADFATVRRGGSITIPVLANDYDPDGDQFTIVHYSNSLSGSVRQNLDGTLTYQSRSNFFFRPNDFFTYTISDGKGETWTATVQIQFV
jgi:hypothetical protein